MADDIRVESMTVNWLKLRIIAIYRSFLLNYSCFARGSGRRSNLSTGGNVSGVRNPRAVFHLLSVLQLNIFACIIFSGH